MLVLLTYDVNTTTAEGRKRLRKVAKVCINYGQRVQNSVFECSISPSQLLIIRKELEKIIDMSKDNIRIYHLGKNWEKRVESMGLDYSYNPDKGFLFL